MTRGVAETDSLVEAPGAKRDPEDPPPHSNRCGTWSAQARLDRPPYIELEENAVAKIESRPDGESAARRPVSRPSTVRP